MIYVDGKSRELNFEYLKKELAKNLPDYTSEDIERLVEEIEYRLDSLEFDSQDFEGTTIEDYYIETFLAYLEDHSLNNLLMENDDLEIWKYNV